LFESTNSPSKKPLGIPLPKGGPPPPMPAGSNFPPPRSQPPPPPQPPALDLTPKVPYYELPAGMIVPLVKMEDVTVS